VPAVSTPSAAARPAPLPSAEPAAPTVAPTPGTLRLALAADSELLKTEQTRSDILKQSLEKVVKNVDAAPASAAELAYVKALAANPAAPPALPASWATFETVVLLRIEPQRTVRDKQVSGGGSHVVIVHPPAREPAFSAVYTQGGSRFSDPSQDLELGSWLKTHLKLREKGKTP